MKPLLANRTKDCLHVPINSPAEFDSKMNPFWWLDNGFTLPGPVLRFVSLHGPFKFSLVTTLNLTQPLNVLRNHLHLCQFACKEVSPQDANPILQTCNKFLSQPPLCNIISLFFFFFCDVSWVHVQVLCVEAFKLSEMLKIGFWVFWQCSGRH